ncbi:MAG: hypothetical protein NXI00_09550 [Cytophagales bacterium]|nr:hypothetical protein [Cytophagales bacterium]
MLSFLYRIPGFFGNKDAKLTKRKKGSTISDEIEEPFGVFDRKILTQA